MVLLATRTTGHLNFASRWSIMFLPTLRKEPRDLKGILIRMYLLRVPSAYLCSTCSADVM